METKTIASVITPEELLSHWQGHRNLTRKVIAAFPEEKLFTYSIGGMRTFARLAMEIIALTNSGMDGVISENWKKTTEMAYNTGEGMPETKEELLVIWDETTNKLNRLWNEFTLERFHEITKAFGEYEGPVFSQILYWIDNEVHHRGQGFVYLRSLGVEPPFFWDRF